jgi:hypothetical protein
MEGFSQILREDHGYESPQQLQDYWKTIQEKSPTNSGANRKLNRI